MASNSILQRLLANSPNWATLPLRLVLNVVMAAHGAQKLFGWFGGHGLEGTGGFMESNLGLSLGVFWAALAGGRVLRRVIGAGRPGHPAGLHQPGVSHGGGHHPGSRRRLLRIRRF